jgi:hypothetical protein
MYAYLRVQIGEWDRVGYPDGTHELVERGTGPQTAANWRSEQTEVRKTDETDKHMTPAPAENEEREEAKRIFAQRHSKWQQELDRALDGALSITHIRSIREEFEKAHPEPTLDDAEEESDSADAVENEQPPTPEVTIERRWLAWLAEFEPKYEVVLGPSGSYPRAAVARTLTELERLGWTVVHVTEDRSVRHTAQGAQVDIVGAWMLLHSAA